MSNGHEKCQLIPQDINGLILTKDDPQYILEASKKAEKKLQQFINEVKNRI